jgi:dipeptidyl aminopeptidase/acylaminoacyl peptidase
VRGIFSTRIAYVKQEPARPLPLAGGRRRRRNEQLPRSNEPIISPSWSPDGTKVAYVSFEQKKPVVYVQNLVTGQRTVIANEKGSNSAPAWSPDGSKLAVSLSKDGQYPGLHRERRRQRPAPRLPTATASTPSRNSRPTARASISPATAAAVRRSTA